MNDPSTAQSDSRTRWNLAVSAFLVATLVAAFLIGFRVKTGPGRMGWIYAYFAFSSFHCTVLGFWVGFGRWRWRLPVAVLGGLLLGMLSDFAFGGNSLWEFETYTMGIFIVVSVTTFALRLGKGTLRLMHANERGHVNVLQFSIRRMMAWTTACAVLLAVGRIAIELLGIYGGRGIATNDLVMIGSLAFFVSIATVANVWALLQIRISLARITILVLATAAAATILYAIYEGGSLFAVTAVMSQLLTAAVMLMLRMRGLRFMHKQVTPAA